MTSQYIVTGRQAAACRRRAGVSQEAFWAPIGITQSTASRYESKEGPLPLLVAAGVTIVVSAPPQLRGDFLSVLKHLHTKRRSALKKYGA